MQKEPFQIYSKINIEIHNIVLVAVYFHIIIKQYKKDKPVFLKKNSLSGTQCNEKWLQNPKRYSDFLEEHLDSQ